MREEQNCNLANLMGSLNEYLNGDETTVTESAATAAANSSTSSSEEQKPSDGNDSSSSSISNANSTDDDIDVIAQEDTLLKRILTRVANPNPASHSKRILSPMKPDNSFLNFLNQREVNSSRNNSDQDEANQFDEFQVVDDLTPPKREIDFDIEMLTYQSSMPNKTRHQSKRSK